MKDNSSARKKFIKKFCRALEVYWIQTPELRFGQLPGHIQFELDSVCLDLFYYEDQDIYNHMDKKINERKI